MSASQEQIASLQNTVDRAREQVREKEKELAKAQAFLNRATVDLQNGSQDNKSANAIIMRNWGYKDVVMPGSGGLLISQMVGNRAYDHIITNANLRQHAGYDQWQARNFCAFHRGQGEHCLGWE